MDRSLLRLLPVVLAMHSGLSAIAESPRLELREGDRVLFVGGEFFQHEAEHGYLETALTSASPRRTLTFRNLGCEDNTVWAESAGALNLPQAGHRQLWKRVADFKPTVVLLNFGAAESAAGESGVKRFAEGYDKLIDELVAAAQDYLGEKPLRLVFLTPHQLETHGALQHDVSERNRILSLYAEVIRQLAARREGWLVELFDRTAQITLNRKGSPSPAPTGPEPPRGFRLQDGVWQSLPLTQDGVRLSSYGSLRVSRMVIQELKLPHAEFLLQLDSAGEAEADTQIMVSNFQTDGAQVKFRAILSRLPEPPTPLFPQDVEYFVIAGGGLSSGNYHLKIDGQVAAQNPTVLVGFPVRAGADYEQAEQLRRKIVAKNRLFTSCWRPMISVTNLQAMHRTDENSTNAALARFAPLINKAETEIAELKRPKLRQYEIVPRSDDDP